jgi:Tol biopolymer transport system component
VRRLTFGNVDLQPSWAPDGGWIVFLRIDARTRTSGIWLVRPDGSGLHRILRHLPNVSDPVWSPRGDRLVVSDGARLLVVAPDGSQRRVLTLLAADAKGGRVDPEPAWSPDGNEVVFVQVRRGGVSRSDLWLVHADGTARLRLTRSTGLDFAPSWGP